MNHPNFFQPSVAEVILILFAVFLLVQIIYLLAYYLRLALYPSKNEPLDREGPPVSIIVCARNEERNLERNLPLLLQQNYPNYEVVLVNDRSEDETKWLLRKLSAQNPQLKVVEIENHVVANQGKKFAVSIGIKAASHEHLLFTDADCWPSSNDWIARMVGQWGSETSILLGYSPYAKEKGFLNAFIRFEAFHTALNYLSFALAGNPYMGVGRNLAYLKSLFFKGKGFASHMHIRSGDDDLFVNQHANAHNCQIVMHPDAQMWSTPKNSFNAYFRQKARHIGASKAYKKSHQWLLALPLVTGICFYLAAFAVLGLEPTWWPYVLSGYALRLLLQWSIYAGPMKRLQVGDLLWALPFLDLFYLFFTNIHGLFQRNKKQPNW
jgi:biofilm PGA synthesis N-glycosyltransferase PgaC